MLFVLVVGEELGWRGVRLAAAAREALCLTASLILGVLWGLWHLPTFLVPGTPQYGLPLVAFVLLTVEYSILMTWVFLHTHGSVLIATFSTAPSTSLRASSSEAWRVPAGIGCSASSTASLRSSRRYGSG